LLALLKPETKARSQKPHRRKPSVADPPKPDTGLSVQDVSGKPGPIDQPKLCTRCRGLAYAICRECALRSEPGLVLGPDGVIYRVRTPPEPVIKGWHRCENCGEKYHGVLPPFGTPKLCPKCVQPAKPRRRLMIWNADSSKGATL
jgi:hypothetical protein